MTLNPLFNPRSIAFVGASEDPEKLSGQPLRNLLKVGFKGDIYPIHPRAQEVCGIVSYKSLSDIPSSVDVAMICLPGQLAVDAAEECARLGIPNAILAVSGFSEMGTEEGRRLQQKLKEISERGTRIVGPNCNGIYNVIEHISIGYNVTHSMNLKPGNIAVLSHSGALFSSIVAMGETMGSGLGYSYFVSAGNEADLTILDYMEYMIEDQATTIIALVLDGVSHVERFRKLCKAAKDKEKKIVALKIGESQTGVQATMAHSSRLAGSSEGYRALLSDCGVIQVPNLESLVGVCALLSKYHSPESFDAVGISTSGAGCAVMADTAERYGISFPPLSRKTVESIEQEKGFATPINPYDFGASGPRSIGYMTRALAHDQKGRIVLFYSTILQTETIRRIVAEEYSQVCEEMGRPPFVVIAPGPLSPEEMEIYKKYDIVIFASSDVAFQSFKAIKDVHQTPFPQEEDQVPEKYRLQVTEKGIDPTEIQSALRAAGIPLPKEKVVSAPEDLAQACQTIGFPVVVKGLSKDAIHKSDAGLVWLDIKNEEDLERVHKEIVSIQENGLRIDQFLVQEYLQGEAEVFIGIHKDHDVGYLLVLGSGGKYTEVIQDITTLTIPSSPEKIRAHLSTTKIGKILAGSRNNGITPDSIVDIAYRLQGLVAGNEDLIAAIDLNPVLVSRQRSVAVDYRILLEK